MRSSRARWRESTLLRVVGYILAGALAGALLVCGWWHVDERGERSASWPPHDPRAPEYVENPHRARTPWDGLYRQYLCSPLTSTKLVGTIDAYFPRWYLHQFHGPEFAPFPFGFTAAVLNDIGEPRLICPRTVVDESFRMFWDPGRRDHRVWSVRIDRRGDVYELLAVESETRDVRGWSLYETEIRTTELQRITEVISAEQWQQLQLYIDSAHLWHMAPTSPTRGCQGEEWTYELVSEHGYQVVNRQQWRPSTFRNVGAYVLTELLPPSARPDLSIRGMPQPPLKYRAPGGDERTWWRWVLWRVGMRAEV